MTIIPYTQVKGQNSVVNVNLSSLVCVLISVNVPEFACTGDAGTSSTLGVIIVIAICTNMTIWRSSSSSSSASTSWMSSFWKLFCGWRSEEACGQTNPTNGRVKQFPKRLQTAICRLCYLCCLLGDKKEVGWAQLCHKIGEFWSNFWATMPPGGQNTMHASLFICQYASPQEPFHNIVFPWWMTHVKNQYFSRDVAMLPKLCELCWVAVGAEGDILALGWVEK